MKRKGLTAEKRIAALLLLPALITIAVIAIWPVVRSFWISLYDVRLNNPTKSQIHQQPGLNVEKFAEVVPVLKRNIADASQKADADTAVRLKELQAKVAGLQAMLEENESFASTYEKVDALLFEGQPVPEEIRVVTLTADEADAVRKQVDAINRLAKPIADENIAGLVNGVNETLISPNFVGFAYYLSFLKDQRLMASLENTFLFTVISVSLELVLGLFIAVLINRAFKGRGLVRAAVLIPWAIPTVVSALMWKYLFDGQNGVVALLFEQVGIVEDMGLLLTTKAGSLSAVIFADVWKTTPFMALLLLAGLQTIPHSLYEAADVDGAGKVQQFFRITLPLLKSTILVALLFRTLDAFRIFDLVYVLTGGGPANATETISIYAYKTMFAQMNFGEGSALSVIVFICVAIMSMIYVRLLGTDLVADGRNK
ncbi:carbohydrate ABC transporter permease [Laceyella putida]|uniref:Carbohydrate ABC transporter permease n=1 Tax=Laceyella putida TaxID=110101 RepID=A0ABW2RJX5_9BACL